MLVNSLRASLLPVAALSTYSPWPAAPNLLAGLAPLLNNGPLPCQPLAGTSWWVVFGAGDAGLGLAAPAPRVALPLKW